MSLKNTATSHVNELVSLPLPVMRNDVLVGIVAMLDVLKFIIRDQMTTIEELENYVMDETGGSG